MTNDPLLDVQSLCVNYATPDGDLPALRDVSFSLARGEALAVVGESGSGKSTLAMAILGLMGAEATISQGRILYDGKNLAGLPAQEMERLRGNRMSMVFQDPFGTLNPGMTVGQQVAEPLIRHQGMSRDKALKRVVTAFDEVGLPRPEDLLSAYPHHLSGGMQQRALIASALICEPDLIILDEPTTALDVTIEAQILDLLDRLRRQRNLAMLFITHNLGVMNKICDRTCVLYAGSVLENGPKDVLLRRPAHPYTQGLLAAVPRLDRQRKARLTPIPGRLPELGQLPSGCVFHPRCAYATEECRTDAQVLRPHDGREVRCWRAGALPEVEAEQAEEHGPRHQPGTEELVGVRDLHKTFPLKTRISFGAPNLINIERRKVHAVAGVSLSVAPGEVVGLVGESGSGKSTLGRCLVRLTEVSDGRIMFDGSDTTHARAGALRQFRSDVQMVFQNPTSSLNPRRRVGAAIGRSLDLLGDVSGRDRQKRIDELLDSVGLPTSFANRFPHQLSGGERQRISIARALASDPRFIVCDEAVSALDVSVQATVLNLLAELRERLNLAYLFISHDLSAVSHIADRIAVMYAGVICEEGPVDAILNRPSHPYTEALLSAVPTIDDATAAGERIRLREGLPPTMEEVSGCRFYSRCPHKIGEICENVTPPVISPCAGHCIHCHLSEDELRAPTNDTSRCKAQP